MAASEFTPLTEFGAVPDGWLWGAATAAHQIEGGNTNNDWWVWEHTEGSTAKDSSGDACDSWNRWLEDLQLCQRMGLNSYRFSLEWSRIEPAEGEFSLVALEHYRQVLVAANEMGLKTCVTFHHFTTPQWMADKGGWENPEIVALFARFCDVAVQHLGDHIDIACTINELNIPGFAGYVGGEFTPGRKDDWDALEKVQANFRDAHEAARKVLKEGPGDFPVGLTLAVIDIVSHQDSDWDGPAVGLLEMPEGAASSDQARLMFTMFLDSAKADDFIGVQTYSTEHMGPDGQMLPVPDHVRRTTMGWTYTPEALGQTVRLAAAYTGLPVYVTENGVATEDDAERVEYYSRALVALRAAMDDGVDVRGYFAWSLLDNFEWAHGYSQKFGLHEVDPVTFARTPKPSADWYAKLIASTR